MFRVFNLLNIFSFPFHYIINYVSLNLISDNHCRYYQYIFYLRKLICEIIDNELTLSHIEKQYRVSKNFVWYVLFIHKSQSTKILNSRSDKFKMFIIRESKYIIWIARQNLKIIYKNLKFRSRSIVSSISFMIYLKKRISLIKFIKSNFY